MSNGSIGSIIALAILVTLSAYFSATETAFSSLNKIRIKNKAGNGDQRAAMILSMIDNYDKLISTILVGNNIVNIAAASLATVIFTTYFGDAGVTLSTAVMTVVVLIFGEVSPKSLAKEAPESFAYFSAPIMRVLLVVLTPINFLFSQWKKLLAKIFRLKKSEGMTEEELLTVVDEVERDGGIKETEGDLIRSAIGFDDLEAQDILTPRVQLVAVNQYISMEDLQEIFVKTNYSRLPVYKDNIDAIIGVIHEKDFYIQMYNHRNTILPVIQRVLYVSPSIKISDLLRTLQKNQSHLAVVVDELGGTMGIVTMDDILEELVGEIWDEHDEIIEFFKKIDDSRYLVAGNANLDEMFEYLNMDVTVDDLGLDSVTVSGWAAEQLGHIPEKGDEFTFDILQVTVTKTDGRRLVEACVTVEQPEEQGEQQKQKS